MRPSEQAASQSVPDAAVRGLAWLMSSRVVLLIVNFVSVAILARLLTPADFGVMAAVLTVIGFVQNVTYGTLGYPLVQRETIGPEDISAAFWLSLGIATLAAVSIAIASPYIEAFLDFPHLATALAVTASALPLKSVAGVAIALLQRNHRFRDIAVVASIPQIVGYVLPTMLLAPRLGLWALVFGQVASAAIELIVACSVARSSLRIFPIGSAFKNALRVGGLFSVMQTLNWLALNATPVIIGTAFGAVPLGLYSRASKFFSIATDLLGNTVADVLLPSFSRIQSERERLSSVFKRALGLSLFVSGVASSFVVVHGEAIIRLLLGEKWLASVPVLEALFAGLVARTAYKVSETLAFGEGRLAGVTLRQALLLSLVLACTSIGAVFGLVGVAAGLSCAFWIFYAVSLWRACSSVGISARWAGSVHLRVLLFAGLIVIIDGGVCLATQSLGFWVSHALGATTGVALAAAYAFVAPPGLAGPDIVWVREALKGRFRPTSVAASP